MIDSYSAYTKVENVLCASHQSSTRVQLLRILEVLEAMIESQSRDLVQAHAPRLIQRVAELVQAMDITDITIGITERMTPILWRMLIEYPELEVKETSLTVLNELHWKYDRSSVMLEKLTRPSLP